MHSLMDSLNQSLSMGWGPALFAALIWGVLSILLSPCHLAGIPLIVAYVNRRTLDPLRGAMRLRLCA
ncbi:MAG: hypothetical protein JJU29_22150 [Verrucomicrobia bacterium]|nr:hypothetical protein [Verrucomicrobiota bacterium]MCH8514490.1 hypothetical protein [Kiritimatiellia bacterium]